MSIRAGEDALAKEALVRKGEKEAERDETKKAAGAGGLRRPARGGAQGPRGAAQGCQAAPGDLCGQGSLQSPGEPTKTSAFDDFDRMSSRIDAAEAEAGLDAETGGRTRNPSPPSAG